MIDSTTKLLTWPQKDQHLEKKQGRRRRTREADDSACSLIRCRAPKEKDFQAKQEGLEMYTSRVNCGGFSTSPDYGGAKACWESEGACKAEKRLLRGRFSSLLPATSCSFPSRFRNQPALLPPYSPSSTASPLSLIQAEGPQLFNFDSLSLARVWISRLWSALHNR